MQTVWLWNNWSWRKVPSECVWNGFLYSKDNVYKGKIDLRYQSHSSDFKETGFFKIFWSSRAYTCTRNSTTWFKNENRIKNIAWQWKNRTCGYKDINNANIESGNCEISLFIRYLWQWAGGGRFFSDSSSQRHDELSSAIALIGVWKNGRRAVLTNVSTTERVRCKVWTWNTELNLMEVDFDENRKMKMRWYKHGIFILNWSGPRMMWQILIHVLCVNLKNAFWVEPCVHILCTCACPYTYSIEEPECFKSNTAIESKFAIMFRIYGTVIHTVRKLCSLQRSEACLWGLREKWKCLIGLLLVDNRISEKVWRLSEFFKRIYCRAYLGYPNTFIKNCAWSWAMFCPKKLFRQHGFFIGNILKYLLTMAICWRP